MWFFTEINKCIPAVPPVTSRATPNGLKTLQCHELSVGAKKKKNTKLRFKNTPCARATHSKRERFIRNTTSRQENKCGDA